MNTGVNAPPRWAECLLERLLPARNRQTITGDLGEEYVEVILPRSGSLLADLWYLRQVFSLAACSLPAHRALSAPLLIASTWTLICAAWLAFMESILQHPGYPARIGLAVTIALIGLATILARLLRLGFRRERWLWAAAVPLLAFGCYAFVHNMLSAHFEGFTFLLSPSFVLQGALMLLSLGRPTPSTLPFHGKSAS